jgi:tRNA dimethylallyltransferase
MIKLLAIVGPTASGKSGLALKLADEFNGELICADSLTVRKHVDIGSAKPSQEEQAAIAHHLLDVAEPCADFTAADFKRLADETIADIQKRGKLPILVGGTGLYIDAVLYDFQFLPRGDRAKREALNQMSAQELLKKVESKGFSVDGIDVHNKRRLVRLLETGGARPERSEVIPNTLIIGVNPPALELKKAISARVNKMIRHNLEDEVKALAERYSWECEALKGIGYREWRAYFEGTQDLETTKQKIISSTNNLAKRQRTWLKRNTQINWFSTPNGAYEYAQKHLLNT